MFNVKRPQPGPDCSKDYPSKEVVDALREVFYGKCYLCEDETGSPEVDHFISQEEDPSKKYDWNNLYYICARCNKIKGTARSILDCCNPEIDVSKAVKCEVPAIPNKDIIVKAQDPSEVTANTADLINRCYNEKNTGIRGITQELLHENIFEEYNNFLEYRRVLKSKKTVPQEKNNAKNHLKNMMQDAYPFSIFWKWHIWGDDFLVREFP